jgi:hypothetical protein
MRPASAPDSGGRAGLFVTIFHEEVCKGKTLAGTSDLGSYHGVPGGRHLSVSCDLRRLCPVESLTVQILNQVGSGRLGLAAAFSVILIIIFLGIIAVIAKIIPGREGAVRSARFVPREFELLRWRTQNRHPSWEECNAPPSLGASWSTRCPSKGSRRCSCRRPTHSRGGSIKWGAP